MFASVHVKRNGWENLWRGGSITEEGIEVYASEGRVEIKTTGMYVDNALKVRIDLDELRMIVSALRSAGIELDPERERQRELAWELAQSLGSPQRALAEAAD